MGYCQVFVSQKDCTLFKKATTNDIMIYIILTTADLTEQFIRNIYIKKEKRVWYFKERKIIPIFIVEYIKNKKIKKRRISLNVRYYEEEFKEGKKFFEQLGFKVNSQ